MSPQGKEAAEEVKVNPMEVKEMKMLFYQAVNTWRPDYLTLQSICKNYALANPWYSDWIQLQGGWPPDQSAV